MAGRHLCRLKFTGTGELGQAMEDEMVGGGGLAILRAVNEGRVGETAKHSFTNQAFPGQC